MQMHTAPFVRFFAILSLVELRRVVCDWLSALYKVTTLERLTVYSKMASFDLSEDRIVSVKEVEGERIVVLKQKDSDVKFAEFTKNRSVLLFISEQFRKPMFFISAYLLVFSFTYFSL